MTTSGTLTSKILLRETTEDDLPSLFEHQLDPVANQMAAFTVEDPADRDAFMAHWSKILVNDTITKKTILYEGQVVGYVAGFEQFGLPSVGYWLSREYWGKGITTKALSLFVADLKTRPLYARAAKDNIASLRVLEKCGFSIVNEEKGFSNARGEDVEEFVLSLTTSDEKPASV